MMAVIETLLNDNATMVLGSAVTTYNEVCPNEWGLIHRNFRKFCGLLADLDEWGQISTLHMLTRYGRTQFVNPDAEKVPKKKERAAKPAATEGESDESSDDEEADVFAAANSEALLDPDHRLLLKSALGLLQSRNVGVVMAVATLYHYLAPRMEQVKIAKSLIRTLHTRKEAKYVLLNGILTFVQTNPDMFRPHLSDFFVESNEPVYIRKIKIDIITLLANEGNISRILREFKIYVSQEDKDFVKASIQAIGRCAMLLPEVTETCMQCLTSLIGTHSEAAVAEAIVVIKKLLQVGDKTPSKEANGSSGSPDKSSKSGKGKFSDVIKHMAKLLDTVQNPQARASIAWIISEHVTQLKTIAPDVLRKLAKSFPTEDLLVKLQTLNLGVKLYLTNPEQTTLLFQYVLNLAKYDTSYDLRDRARLIRRIVFNAGDKANELHAKAEQLFITQKPVPTMDVITPTDSEGHHFYPSSISSLLGHTAYGYLRVPAWATEKSNSELRNPIKHEWESFAYSAAGLGGPGVNRAPVNAISWDQVQNMQQNMNATSFSSANPASPPPAAHAVAGYATREEYEKAFWGDENESSSSGSRSRSGSTSSSGSGSSSGSSGSYSGSDDEEDTHTTAHNDDDLFGAAAAPSTPAASAPASAASNDVHTEPTPVEAAAESAPASAEDFAPPQENGDWLAETGEPSLI